MSEENNIEEFCESIVMEICSNIEAGSIKAFLYMVEGRIKDVLIDEGEIEDPKDISELKEEKIKVKDLVISEKFYKNYINNYIKCHNQAKKRIDIIKENINFYE